MIEIEYKGANTVVITAKKSQLIIDPKLSAAGGKDLAVKDSIELATEPRLAVNSSAAKLSIEGPGEYEIGDFSIWGVGAVRHIDTPQDELKATIYRIETDDVRIALLGNIAPKLTEDQLEALGVVDIAIVPVGGGGLTLDATSAAAIVRQLDPKVVIPVHYADPTLKYEVPQDNAEVFVKELGAPTETVSKYKIKSAQVLPETLTTIVIDRS